jgi:preprotein translocase subunit SecF
MPKMFYLIPPGTRYDFIGKKNFWLSISALVMTTCIVSMIVRGFNLGVDFAGGTDVQVNFGKEPAVGAAEIREAMRTSAYENAEVATFGDSTNSYLIRLPQISYLAEARVEELKRAIEAKFGDKNPDGTFKPLFRKEGGFLLEGGRVELGLTKAVPPAEMEKIFDEQKIPLRRGVEETDSETHEYVVRFKLGDMTKEQFQKGKEEIRAKFGATLVSEDLELRRDRATLRFSQAVPTSQIEKVLEDAKFDVADPVEILRKERNEYIVHMVGLSAKIAEDLRKAFPKNKVFVERVDSVGPKVGAQLREDAIVSLLYAIIGILIYTAFRFDFIFAPGAVIALIHDAIFTVGYFSLFQVEFTLGTVAAVLTIIGYSVNDTIVIYDRCRENIAKYREWKLADILNLSMNEMLGRTLLTSMLTIFTVLSMLVLGGGLIEDFALALLVGMISGVYSTVFIAAPVTLLMEKLVERIKARRAMMAAER